LNSQAIAKRSLLRIILKLHKSLRQQLTTRVSQCLRPHALIDSPIVEWDLTSAASTRDKSIDKTYTSSREALPRLDNYRISKRALKRPSLGELHGEPQQQAVSVNAFEVFTWQ